jgi:hypothetical protein
MTSTVSLVIATYNHVMEVTPAGKEVYLHADKSLPYGVVVEVMAAAQRAGVGQVIRGTGAVRSVIDRAMAQLGVQYAWGGGNGRGPTLGVRDGGIAEVSDTLCPTGDLLLSTASLLAANSSKPRRGGCCCSPHGLTAATRSVHCSIRLLRGSSSQSSCYPFQPTTG